MTAFRVHMNNQIPVVIDDVDYVGLQDGYVKLFGEKREERSRPVLAIFSESQFAYLERVEILGTEGAFDEWECDDAGCVCQDLADDEISNTPGQQRTAPLGVGDHVVATRVGAYNGETGTITQVLDEGMVFIRWDNPEYGELCFSADGLQRTPS